MENGSTIFDCNSLKSCWHYLNDNCEKKVNHCSVLILLPVPVSVAYLTKTLLTENIFSIYK